MRLSDSRYEYIKLKVVKLFVDYNITCIPIDGFALARKMGITLVAYTSLSSELCFSSSMVLSRRTAVC